MQPHPNEGNMNLLRFTHSGGTEIYINPRLVRAVLPQGEKGTRLVFDPTHEVNVKEQVVQVLEALRSAS